MGLPGRQQSVLDMLALIQVCSLLAVASAAPQFLAISEVVNSRTGEVIPVDVNNQDIAGCLVGPSGERVCPLVAVGSDGRSQVIVLCFCLTFSPGRARHRKMNLST